MHTNLQSILQSSRLKSKKWSKICARLHLQIYLIFPYWFSWIKLVAVFLSNILHILFRLTSNSLESQTNKSLVTIFSRKPLRLSFYPADFFAESALCGKLLLDWAQILHDELLAWFNFRSFSHKIISGRWIFTLCDLRILTWVNALLYIRKLVNAAPFRDYYVYSLLVTQSYDVSSSDTCTLSQERASIH